MAHKFARDPRKNYANPTRGGAIPQRNSLDAYAGGDTPGGSDAIFNSRKHNSRVNYHGRPGNANTSLQPDHRISEHSGIPPRGRTMAVPPPATPQFVGNTRRVTNACSQRFPQYRAQPVTSVGEDTTIRHKQDEYGEGPGVYVVDPSVHMQDIGASSLNPPRYGDLNNESIHDPRHLDIHTFGQPQQNLTFGAKTSIAAPDYYSHATMASPPVRTPNPLQSSYMSNYPQTENRARPIMSIGEGATVRYEHDKYGNSAAIYVGAAVHIRDICAVPARPRFQAVSTLPSWQLDQ